MRMKILTAALLASTIPAAAQQKYIYTCKILDYVSVDANGKLYRDKELTRFVEINSPFTYDTSTGDFKYAAGAERVMLTVTHGSDIQSMSAYDIDIPLSLVLHVRVDMPGSRFSLHGTSTTFSGTCERKEVR
jgi:hypothetical protein